MKAYIQNPRSLLGANLAGALRWEGHHLTSSTAEAEVIFDTANGFVYRAGRPLAQFVFGEMLGPGEDIGGSVIGYSILSFLRGGQLPRGDVGACVTDARDVALAMITAAERGVTGEFEVVGPFITLEDLAGMLAGTSQSRTSVAIPELEIAFRPVEETVNDVVKWHRYGSSSLVA
jgi:nucleoside-diphosphate-sugar epimerase